MGTPLVIGIIIYLLLIITLTAYFLKIHAQKSLVDSEQNNSLPLPTDNPNVEKQFKLFEISTPGNTPDTRSTDTEAFPTKKRGV